MKTIALLIALSSLTAYAQITPNKINLFTQYSKDIQGKTADQIHKANLSNYQKFLKLDVDKYVDYEKAKFLKASYAQETINLVTRNPVVSSYYSKKYDPQNLGIGFCFGRAMFIHLELVQRGFDRDSIKKAYVVGPMQTPDGASWGWHVTTIAQTKDARGNKKWFALDPITGLTDVEGWYSTMRNQFSKDKKLKLYIAESTRFGTTGVYDENMLADKFYNNYFIDMRKWFDNESRNTNRYAHPIEELD